MILDSSAVIAILMQEPESERLQRAIRNADNVDISAVTFVEVGIACSYKKGSPMEGLIENYFSRFEIGILDFTNEHRKIALDAWWRFGKSRSKAKLNFGDCVTYATAKLAGEPLLCVGKDFPLTDLELATY